MNKERKKETKTGKERRDKSMTEAGTEEHHVKTHGDGDSHPKAKEGP